MPSPALQSYHGSYLMPAFEWATVADAMHPGILTCPADAPMVDVARMMATNNVHCIAVMSIAHDDSGERLIWGIISDVDLVRAGVRDGRDRSGSASALAQQPLVSVAPGTPLREAGELMLANDVSHLVVIEPESQRPVGVLSTLDFAGVLACGEP